MPLSGPDSLWSFITEYIRILRHGKNTAENNKNRQQIQLEKLKKEIIELFMGHLVSLALNGQYKNTASNPSNRPSIVAF